MDPFYVKIKALSRTRTKFTHLYINNYKQYTKRNYDQMFINTKDQNDQTNKQKIKPLMK